MALQVAMAIMIHLELFVTVKAVRAGICSSKSLMRMGWAWILLCSHTVPQ